MSNNSNFYDNHVKELNAQYLAVSAEDVHKSWISLVQKSGRALDVGTGVGRDAGFLAEQGYTVTAVDASANMLEQAKANFPHLSVNWLVDTLPSLSKVRALGHKFDVILVSAVWQHIPHSQRQKSLRVLSGLLAPNGKLIITLRHGDFTDGRTSYDVSADEIKSFSRHLGLKFHAPDSNQAEPDLVGRAGVNWQTVILTLPDDGTGAFGLIRNIVINDLKAATYKMALIRSILRIAEGHVGAVVEPESTVSKVAIPLGLVAMYWMKLFKPLVDKYKMPQNSNPNKGLGFVKANGWQKLSAKHITLPGTKTAVFELDRLSPRAPKNSILVDYKYLVSFGVLLVPRDIWNTLSDYSCWIEPALVNEWIRIMHGFEAKTLKSFSLDDYHAALKWEDQTRSTDKVKQRVKALQAQQDVLCTWTKTKLFKEYDIDHAFPFSRWPNNDLWNLVPSTRNINRRKSDKLLTEQRLLNSKSVILDFWKQAWEDEASLFFSQANLSLPELAINNDAFTDVFEAMCMQRQRIKNTQQLADF